MVFSRPTLRRPIRAWRTARTAVTLLVSIAAMDVSLGAPLVGAPTAEPPPVAAVAAPRVKPGVAPTMLAHSLASAPPPDPLINSPEANETASWAAPRTAAAAAGGLGGQGLAAFGGPCQRQRGRREEGHRHQPPSGGGQGETGGVGGAWGKSRRRVGRTEIEKKIKGAAPGAQGGDGAMSGGGLTRRGGVAVSVCGNSLTGRQQLCCPERGSTQQRERLHPHSRRGLGRPPGGCNARPSVEGSLWGAMRWRG